jgi:hypothetical protein
MKWNMQKKEHTITEKQKKLMAMKIILAWTKQNCFKIKVVLSTRTEGLRKKVEKVLLMDSWIQNRCLTIEQTKTYLNSPSNDNRSSTTEYSPGHQNGGQPKRPRVEMPVKNQLQGMLAVFEPLDRAQSKKNFEPSFVKIG